MSTNPEPASIRIGDTITWLRSYHDCVYVDHTGTQVECKASDGYTLTYYAKNAAANFSIVAATHDTDDYLVSVTAAVTAAYTAGTYSWAAYVSKGAGASLKRHLVDQGSWELLANLAASGNYDDRTHAKTVVDKIEAVIEGRADQDTKSYTIGGRALEKWPIADLLRFRALYKGEYENEQIEEKINNGEPSPRKLLVRFTQSS